MRRFGLDMLMLVLFILVMGFRMLGQVWHEVLGVGLLVAMLVHLVWNRRWFASLVRGCWGRVRLLQTVLNVLFIVSACVALGTGVVISNHVFAKMLVDVPWHRSIFVHQLHIASAVLMLMLLGMHIGLHWRGLWQRLRAVPLLGRLDAHHRLRGCLVVLMMWAGCAYMRLDHLGDRLMMRHIFTTPAAQLPLGVNYLLLICTLALFAALCYHLQAYWQAQAAAKAKNQRRGAGA